MQNPSCLQLPCSAGSNTGITQQKLETMLDAARWAPTHKQTEPWHFVVLSGSGKAEFEVSTSSTQKQQPALQALYGRICYLCNPWSSCMLPESDAQCIDRGSI
eukprot:GHUV01047125.1.p1 GENE.GHUV01047125.1~~GHUV01047125.1.p1  ORF type:complete len:103 (-),score=13.26 GHUV01047125.1:336-644(-)